jgi:glycosyltransferase involved in cell wall biosynthesis
MMMNSKNPLSDEPITVLHITDQLSKGGAGRALIALAKYSRRLGNFRHECISVKPPFDGVISEGVTEGLPVHVAPPLDEIRALIERADIVQWHWWQDFPLMREDLPRKPTIVWCAVSGEYPPNELTREVVDFADMMVITNPMTRDLPAVRSLSEEERQRKVKVIFESADFERILPIEKIPHDTFNVGWIGTIAPGKYNRRYIEMSGRIALPNVRFIICGEGPLKEEAMAQAKRLRMAERFHFAGYQDDMRKMFALFDVYGFPLDEKTFAGGELNLQEAMAAGLPIVIFPYGGPKRMILHNHNGLIAYSEAEYREYIEYLYYHPDERRRLGENARDYALREYGAENAAKKYNRLYYEMLETAPEGRQGANRQPQETGSLSPGTRKFRQSRTLRLRLSGRFPRRSGGAPSFGTGPGGAAKDARSRNSRTSIRRYRKVYRHPDLPFLQGHRHRFHLPVGGSLSGLPARSLRTDSVQKR